MHNPAFSRNPAAFFGRFYCHSKSVIYFTCAMHKPAGMVSTPSPARLAAATVEPLNMQHGHGTPRVPARARCCQGACNPLAFRAAAAGGALAMQHGYGPPAGPRCMLPRLAIRLRPSLQHRSTCSPCSRV
jgi:hypothetical protein